MRRDGFSIYVVPLASVTDVAKRWARQYRDTDMASKSTVTRLLSELEPSASLDRVDAIIGNDSWTKTCCDRCGEYQRDAIHIGQPPGYESSSIELCPSCALTVALEITRQLQATKAGGR